MKLVNRTDGFFVQQIRVFKWTDPSRKKGFFGKYCSDKKTLHVGCSDHPFPFNPNQSLHAELYQCTKNLDGFDLNTQQFSAMAQAVPGNYYSTMHELKEKAWDVCLIPETIEHVDNIKDFLKSVDENIDAPLFVITAPNAFGHQPGRFDNNCYTEIVHPDHKMWFSPYTLTNCIHQFLPSWNIKEIWLIEYDTMVAVVCEKGA